MREHFNATWDFLNTNYHIRFGPESVSRVLVQLCFETDEEEDRLPSLQQIAQETIRFEQALGILFPEEGVDDHLRIQMFSRDSANPATYSRLAGHYPY